MIKETHIVPLLPKPIRLQEYGIGIFTTIGTKSALKKAIKKQLLFVDGAPAFTGTFIKGNERITLHQEHEIPQRKRFVLELAIVYEDDYLAVIQKPAGILVSGNHFKTIANTLAQNLKKSLQKDAVAPQPAHRLDYPTTGLLLIGKTTAAILALNKLFENRAIAKTYMAVTIGTMKTESTIDTPLDGKNAVTTFKTLQTIPSQRFGYLNLVELCPQTGRKHQIRQHLAGIGNPILGDATYGIPGLILHGKGLYLHATSLAFKHPLKQERMHITATLPKKFLKLFPKAAPKP